MPDMAPINAGGTPPPPKSKGGKKGKSKAWSSQNKTRTKAKTTVQQKPGKGGDVPGKKGKQPMPMKHSTNC